MQPNPSAWVWIGKPAHHDDEDPREKCGDRNGDVHDALLEPEISRHRGRDIEGGLGEQPEGQHAQDDTKEKLVVPLVGRRRCVRHFLDPDGVSQPGWAKQPAAFRRGDSRFRTVRCTEGERNLVPSP